MRRQALAASQLLKADERGALIKRGLLVYAPAKVNGLKLGIVRAAVDTKARPNSLLQGVALGDEIDERRADEDLEDPGLFHFAVGTALTRNRASLAIDVSIAQHALPTCECTQSTSYQPDEIARILQNNFAWAAGIHEIAAEVAQLRQLTIDNAQQQSTLAALQPAIEERFAKLKAAIDLRRTADFDAVQSNFRVGSGPDSIRPVRELVSTMTAAENKLHASRVASVQRLTIAGGIASLLALIVTLGSIAGWIWNTRREARDLVLSIADREKNETQIRQMQKIEAVGQLTGGLAHDLNNMLAETVLNAGLWPTNADAGQLKNALLNLSINARDAMPEGGRLTIETSKSHLDDAYARQNDMPSGDYILITVTDTGTGMTAAVIDKAFDPFFTTKGVGQGTGLGLSQAFGFIKQSGGHIRIYSEAGHGTTIKMYLPRLYDAGPEQAIRTAKAEAWPDLQPGKRKENSAHLILVVEDDARVSEMTDLSLRELGNTVIHANGATAALTKLDAHPDTEMLFTDIVMPDVNGRQLAAEALRRRPDMKVLYTTGFTRNAIVHSGKLDAGLHFIAKPFTLVQIAAKMNEVLAGSPVS